MDLRALRNLACEDFCRDMTSAEFRHIFNVCDALWLHSGDPKTPHAKLTSGLCSNGFVDVLRVLRYTNLCEIMAGQLVGRLHQNYKGQVDWIIGSDHAGVTLSFAVAAQLGAQHDFTEKGDNKMQIWKRFVIQPGEVVLRVEELITTTTTLRAVSEGVRVGHPHPVTFTPLSMVLVHRSSVYEFEGAPIVYMEHYDIKSWEPDECPLCATCSKRLLPKKNWAELTGR